MTAPVALPQRGVRWVLQWAAVLAVLVGAALVAVAFGYQLAGERVLEQAARAGLREAMLPRATRDSVAAAVRQALQRAARLEQATSIELRHRNQPAARCLGLRAGDELAIALSAPAAAAMPAWLTKLVPMPRGAIRAGAEQSFGK